MGFYSYAVYKRCFDWAYGSRALNPGDCITFLELEARRMLLTSEGKLFCVKPE